ncbi:putative non-specific serine/threonine protein kinase [Medicago truncatula]|uniref:Putative non-specific serine/threonine protein kinase n=1 Tax=Medicago truncatula TaxID=3880 RepID=A0A396H430_MEDTR|nr:putative non-specific serine/threonine protein kinase [Medicago truncatula]
MAEYSAAFRYIPSRHETFNQQKNSTVERLNILELFIWNETQPCWRSGPWNGGVFTGIQTMKVAYLNSFQGGDDGEGKILIFYTLSNDKELMIYHLNSQGRLEETWWDDDKK